MTRRSHLPDNQRDARDLKILALSDAGYRNFEIAEMMAVERPYVSVIRRRVAADFAASEAAQ